MSSNARTQLGISSLFSRSPMSSSIRRRFRIIHSSKPDSDQSNIVAKKQIRDAIAPKAKLIKTDVLQSGGSFYTFKVIYTDQRGLNRRSINAQDLLITGPNGFRQLSRVAGIKAERKNRRLVITYRINAAGGIWDTADNGAYTISMRSKQVKDLSGNAVKAGALGKFNVNIPVRSPVGGTPTPSGNTPTPVGGTPTPSGGTPTPTDTIPPTASLTPPAIAAGGGDATFTITYSDNAGIDITSLDANDVVVTGPGGFSQVATLVSIDTNSNGTPRTATYRIGARGGSWSADDNGTYTLSLQTNQVKDINGNFAAAGSVGSFQVALNGADDKLDGSSNSGTLNGGDGNDTVDYSALSKGVVVNLATGKALKPIYGGLDTPKILPLGDSITSGDHKEPSYPGAYRIQFYRDFVADGFSIDLVGSKSNGPDTNFDRNHEGNPGYTISQIKGVIDKTGYFETYKPDVVLLMAGTNDTTNQTDVAQAVNKMKSSLTSLINVIATRSPNTLVVVSSIAPIDKPGTNRNEIAQSFNDSLPGLVNTLKSQGKAVAFVDAGGGLSTSDLNPDGIHPKSTGYDKMGDRWYNGIASRATLTSVENVIGTAYTDSLTGSSGVNILEGAGGADKLTGNGGVDTFVYRNSNHGSDTITDFGSDDFLQISAAGFGGGLTAGVRLSNGVAAATGVLVNGATPVGTSANFLYNNGVLQFDADGVGAGAAKAIATFSGSPSISANQFVIVA
ncbi:MAG TPA: SGNH/GDSL hydrolase family protein [Crinalium sp.]|jgi:lysophospholipase L1-like esterase